LVVLHGRTQHFSSNDAGQWLSQVSITSMWPLACTFIQHAAGDFADVPTQDLFPVT
jgi:hypothetical protein